MKSLFEELNIGDVIRVVLEEPDIESGQSIETAVLGKFTRDGATSLIVDLSGVTFCMADPSDFDLLAFKERVKIVSTLNGGCRIVGDSSFAWGEWDVSVSKKISTRRRAV